MGKNIYARTVRSQADNIQDNLQAAAENLKTIIEALAAGNAVSRDEVTTITEARTAAWECRLALDELASTLRLGKGQGEAPTGKSLGAP